MQMQFDLDYVGHSAMFSFPSDDMHYAAVSPFETQQDALVLYVIISSFFTSAVVLQLSLIKKKATWLLSIY